MALLTANRLTLLELAKRTKNDQVVAIAEILSRTNTMLSDAPYVRANDTTSHTTTKRHYLPAGSWRKINQGVAVESSQTTQVTEGIGMLEAYSRVDSELVNISPNGPAFRLSEDLAFIEGMSQTLSTALLYSTTTGYPEKFNGFSTRYAALTTKGTSAVHNVHGCGSTSTSISTSVWIVQWGEAACHLIYPRFAPNFGIQVIDDGLLTVTDSSGNPYKVYQTHFKINVGLVVRDDRCVQRVCNIKTTGSSNVWSDDVMIRAIREMPNQGAGAVIYANTTVLSQMDIDAKDKSNVYYGPPDAWGRPTMFFRGYPVRQMDAIVDTESYIT
jgi:hypothetical protein